MSRIYSRWMQMEHETQLVWSIPSVFFVNAFGKWMHWGILYGIYILLAAAILVLLILLALRSHRSEIGQLMTWTDWVPWLPWSVQGKANDMPRRATTQRDSWRPCNMMSDDVRRLRCPESRNTPSGAEDEAWSSCCVDALSARRKMSFGEYIRAIHVS